MEDEELFSKLRSLRCGLCGNPADRIVMHRCGVIGGPACEDCWNKHQQNTVDYARVLQQGGYPTTLTCRHCKQDNLPPDHVYSLMFPPDSNRIASRHISQLSYDEVMRLIDEQLAAGEPEDKSDYSTDYYVDPHVEDLNPVDLNHDPDATGHQCDQCGGRANNSFEVNDYSVGDDYKGKFCDRCVRDLVPTWYDQDGHAVRNASVRSADNKNPYIVNDPNQSTFKNVLDTASNYMFGPPTDSQGHEIQNMVVPLSPLTTPAQGAEAFGGKALSNINPTMTGQEETPAFNPGPMKPGLETFSAPTNPSPTTTPGSTPMTDSTKTSALRLAAIDFLAGQNVSDREELLFRAHRHASNRTGQMPVSTAQHMIRDFVAAVNYEIGKTAAHEDEPCDACGAESGEKCRPWCTGKAAYDNDKQDKKTKKSYRTASVSDFPDELMF